MNLELEYSCTEAETEEAKSLDLNRQYGGGPKWRSGLVSYAWGALGVGLVCLRIKTEIAPAHRPWFIAGVIIVSIGVLVVQRFMRAKSTESIIRLEISERELVFVNDRSRTATSWSAFSQCLESPAVFALLDRAKQYLYVVPKRAFPDVASQNWFRALASQPQAVAESSASDASIPARLATTKGVALTVRLKYRDYVSRTLISWRTKGLGLAILLFIVLACLFAPEPPNAVNSRGKTLMIMLGMMTPMLAVVLFVISFIAWRSAKHYLGPQHMAMTGDGIEFASRDGGGFLAWTTYKYYLENRWSFFLWNSHPAVWLMVPKRDFSSLSDLRQCRELLQSNLRPSNWFFL
jgi:hypothetical protein